ncbi:MAG: tetratricopeptide repeat protein [Nitrospirae bacterium]|nr:tetratricopeptide repeat protein [Nitrospirota bacterium]
MNWKRNICVCVYFCVLYYGGTAYAHPDSGFLPDAIAETEYGIVVELNPKDIETRNKLGIVLYRTNKLDEAVKQFNAVLKIKADDFDAHDGMGLVMMKKGRHEEAMKWFEKAIALNKGDALVFNHLGSAYEALGDIGKAIESYEKGLSIKKDGDILSHVEALRKIKNGPPAKVR